MHIERERFSTDPDGMINRGPHGGHARFYRDALYSTLVALQPKLCLEIGTYYGQSSHIFQEYFDKYCPDGLLITCDINRYNDLSPLKNVKQILVYPHIVDSSAHHAVSKDTMLPDTDDPEKIEQSVYYNQALIEYAAGWHSDGCQHIVTMLPACYFDFCFLDGDHHQLSLEKDLAIAQGLLREPQYILVDDTDEWQHDCAKYYHEQIKTQEGVNTYEFQDWPVKVGAALIWNRQEGECTTKKSLVGSTSIELTIKP